MCIIVFILEILLEYLNNFNLGKYNGNLLLFLLSYVLIIVFLVCECVIIDLSRKVKDTANKSWKVILKLMSCKVWKQMDDNGQWIR